MSCSCSSCARRRDESLLRGKGAIEWSRRESTTRRYRDEHRTARARTCTDTFHECAIAFLSTVHPRHDGTSASSHDPPFIFDGPSDRVRFLRRAAFSLSAPPGVFASLHFTQRDIERTEARAHTFAATWRWYARRGPRARARARSRSARLPRAFPILAFCLFPPFRDARWRKTQRASTGRRRAGRRARAETRARAFFAYRHHARAPLSSTRPRIAPP